VLAGQPGVWLPDLWLEEVIGKRGRKDCILCLLLGENARFYCISSGCCDLSVNPARKNSKG